MNLPHARILTRPQLRAWLRTIGHGPRVKLPRSLGAVGLYTAPGGACYTVQPLITGGFIVARLADRPAAAPAPELEPTPAPPSRQQRALARHQAADPHCTCPDCINAHRAALDAAGELEEPAP
jgi:hypothetical protein